MAWKPTSKTSKTASNQETIRMAPGTRDETVQPTWLPDWRAGLSYAQNPTAYTSRVNGLTGSGQNYGDSGLFVRGAGNSGSTGSGLSPQSGRRIVLPTWYKLVSPATETSDAWYQSIYGGDMFQATQEQLDSLQGFPGGKFVPKSVLDAKSDEDYNKTVTELMTSQTTSSSERERTAQYLRGKGVGEEAIMDYLTNGFFTQDSGSGSGGSAVEWANLAQRQREAAMNVGQGLNSQLSDNWYRGLNYALPSGTQYAPGFEPGGSMENLARMSGRAYSPEVGRITPVNPPEYDSMVQTIRNAISNFA